jgi:hypothetical protein
LTTVTPTARSSSWKLNVALASVLLFDVIALPLAARAGSGALGETIWLHLGLFARHAQGNDSWAPMEAARAYATNGHEGERALYDEIFFRRRVKFVYPPTSLLFIDALGRRVLNAISWLATAGAALLAVTIFLLALKRDWPDAFPRDAASAIALGVMACALAITFYPVIKGYTLGQIQAWLNAVFAVLFLAWLYDASAVSGVALGVACLIKPNYALLLPWAAMRRQWRLLAFASGTIGGALIVSVIRFGRPSHVSYLKVLSFIAQRGEAYYPNQSFNGALNRLLFNGVNLTWSVDSYPPPNGLVVCGTIAAAAVLWVAALAVGLHERERGGVFDLAIVSLTVTMTAPLAWEHHYGVLLLVYAITTPRILMRRVLGGWTAPALAASYLLSANYLPFTNRFADTRFNLVQSYLLAGALTMLGLLHGTVLTRSRADVQPR